MVFKGTLGVSEMTYVYELSSSLMEEKCPSYLCLLLLLYRSGSLHSLQVVSILRVYHCKYKTHVKLSRTYWTGYIVVFRLLLAGFKRVLSSNLP